MNFKIIMESDRMISIIKRTSKERNDFQQLAFLKLPLQGNVHELKDSNMEIRIDKEAQMEKKAEEVVRMKKKLKQGRLFGLITQMEESFNESGKMIHPNTDNKEKQIKAVSSKF